MGGRGQERKLDPQRGLWQHLELWCQGHEERGVGEPRGLEGFVGGGWAWKERLSGSPGTRRELETRGKAEKLRRVAWTPQE